MKNSVILVVGLTISALSFAAGVPSGQRLSIRFDKTAYELELNPKTVTYRESGRNYAIKIQPCNQANVRKLASDFSGLMKTYKPKPWIKETSYDVALSSQPGKKRMSISRGSKFGTWLRNLPQNIMYVDAQARISCRK